MKEQRTLTKSFGSILVSIAAMNGDEGAIKSYAQTLPVGIWSEVDRRELEEDLINLPRVKITELLCNIKVAGKDVTEGKFEKEEVTYCYPDVYAIGDYGINSREKWQAVIKFMLKYNCKSDFVKNIYSEYKSSNPNYGIGYIERSKLDNIKGYIPESLSGAVINAEYRLYEETMKNSKTDWTKDCLYLRKQGWDYNAQYIDVADESFPLHEIEGLSYIPIAGAENIGTYGGKVHADIVLAILF